MDLTQIVYWLLQELLENNNNQPLHEYWGGKVKIRRSELQKKTYIEAYKARHDYTNYDQLIKSIKLEEIEELVTTGKITQKVKNMLQISNQDPEKIKLSKDKSSGKK